MNRFLKFLRIIVFLLAILGFLDLLINPKGVQYADSNFDIIPNYFRIATATLIMVILGLLSFHELVKHRINKKFSSLLLSIRILFLALIYFDVSYFLKLFNFHQAGEFVVVAIYTFPIAFVVKDLLQSINFKTLYLFLLGCLPLIATQFYFQAFYEPYEDYWNGIPIMVVHYRIRSWICFIALMLMAVSALRWLDHKREIPS